jgi:hypothetical protein
MCSVLNCHIVDHIYTSDRRQSSVRSVDMIIVMIHSFVPLCTEKLSPHSSNELILSLQEPPETRRLRKNLPIDQSTRLNM